MAPSTELADLFSSSGQKALGNQIELGTAPTVIDEHVAATGSYGDIVKRQALLDAKRLMNDWYEGYTQEVETLYANLDAFIWGARSTRRHDAHPAIVARWFIGT
ncbi:MAG TPA: hypothetical protein DDY14_03475 [Chromatiaceae bacterium]|mgnify:CR=1 FL=1|jgi:hypothetical protein|nr:MAG: hypothetical protein N838_15770 [Thiohalocapsa sp. PB-PSB1]QQO56167.1 MAG: hypothetical protein N838_25230 [Thiohalocapsa sp. PB-PSB1]HBG94387.1 hypothetical protein [Chromatiaceae bacterium]HCS90863.1 hypothetical protein [Chromatiaceae bacterium]